jgi:hypothetical protein
MIWGVAVLTNARDQVIRDLTRHCGDGRLTLDELEDRIDEAYAATTDAELRHVVRDLPALAHDEPVEPAYVEPEPAPPVERRPSKGPCDLVRTQDTAIDGRLKVVFCVLGFVALFNGFFWLAIIIWFALPKLVLPNLRRI